MRPLGDLVLGAAEQDLGQRGLARPVRAHEGVDLAGAHGQVDAPQDGGAALGGAHVQVLDLEQRGGSVMGPC